MRCEKLFSIDLRTLAIFRLGLGILLISDAFIRFSDFVMFYTDDGVLTRALLMSLFDHKIGPSLYMINGDPWFAALLLVCAVVFATGLLVGYRTRVCAVISWVLLISVHSRNPMVLSLGDTLLRLLLFWALFLPLANRFSVDSIHRGHADGKTPECVSSIASAALLLQIPIMYFVTAVMKSGETWHNGQALYYAMNLDHMCNGLGRQLLHFPGLLQWSTHATIIWEYIGPFLLLSPIMIEIVRPLAAAGFFALHIGIAATIRLGLFPYIDFVSLVLYLPGSLWNRVPVSWIKIAGTPIRFAARVLPKVAAYPSGPDTAASQKHVSGRWLSWSIELIVLVLLLYVLWWNVGTMQKKYDIPKSLQGLGYALRLDQRWGMYAPQPTNFDGWYVIEAELVNGRRVNLFNEGSPVVWKKPDDVSSTFKNYRHRKYMMKMLSAGTSKRIIENFSDYLKRFWERKLDLRIRRIRIYFFIERTPPITSPHKFTIRKKLVLDRGYAVRKPGL